MKQSNLRIYPENDFNVSHILDDVDPGTTFLRSGKERAMIPSIYDKAEFSIWAERDPDEPLSKQFMTVHEYFGKPKFRPVDNISNQQLPGEVDRLCEVMKKHDVIISTFTEVDPRDMYRFITKELFNMLTTGKLFHKPLKLVYEEFHSNDIYIVRKVVSDFLRLIFEAHMGPFRLNHLKHSLKNYKEIKNLVRSYENLQLEFMETDEVTINDTIASVAFEIGFYAETNEGLVHHYQGNGRCKLARNNNSWKITNVLLPERVR